MPTTRVRPRARPTARELGTYPSSSITARTRAAVDSSSSPLPLSTRDTVVLLTFARAATSAMVIGTGPPSGMKRLSPAGCAKISEPLPKPVPAVNAGEPVQVNGQRPLFMFREHNRVDHGGFPPH